MINTQASPRGRTLAHVRLHAAVAVLIVAGPAFGEERRDWSVGAGLTHTDNATSVGTGEVSDTLGTLGGGIDYETERRNLQAKVIGAGEWVHYLHHTFKDDFIGSGSGHLGLGIIPERLLWMVDDSFGQAGVDPALPAIPTNRQNINTVSTGLQLHQYFTTNTYLEAGASYGVSRFEQTKALSDNQTSATLGIVHQSSPHFTWSLNANAGHLVYQAPGHPVYDRAEVYGHVQRDMPHRDFLSLDLGGTEVRGFGQKSSSPLVRARWNHYLSPSLIFDVTGNIEYQNSADQVASAVKAGAPGVPQSVVPTQLIHKLSGVGAGLHFERVRTQIAFDASYGKEDYQGTGLDTLGIPIASRKVTNASLTASRRFTQRLTGSLTGMYLRHVSAQALYDDSLRDYGARLSWRVGRATYIDGGYHRQEQRFGLASTGWSANIEYVSINYRPHSKGF